MDFQHCSGNREIDKINKIIHHSQLQSSSYDDNYIELIKEDDIQVGVMLGKGGNGVIYMGSWKQGKRYIENNLECRQENTVIALKRIENPEKI